MENFDNICGGSGRCSKCGKDGMIPLSPVSWGCYLCAYTIDNEKIKDSRSIKDDV
jgi:hypothetical protein